MAMLKSHLRGEREKIKNILFFGGVVVSSLDKPGIRAISGMVHWVFISTSQNISCNF